MAVLRLQPLIRFSKCTISNNGACRGYSEFSTVAFHQLQHPAPTSTSNRFLPRFLDPSIYWRGSRSILKTKEPQGPKAWNPATFYIVRQCPAYEMPLGRLSIGNLKADIRFIIGYIHLYRIPSNPNDYNEA